MEWIYLAILAIIALMTISNRTAINSISKKEKPASIAIEPSSSTPGHTLARTWMEPDPSDSAWAGWRWKCSCGTQGAATNCSKTSLGSEINAIDRYKDHSKAYASVNFDAQQTEIDRITEEYKSYHDKCFCKHTNEDLMVLTQSSRYLTKQVTVR